MFITIPSKPVPTETVREMRRQLLAAERRDKFAQNTAPQTVLEAAAAHPEHTKKCKKDSADCRICTLAGSFYASMPAQVLSRVLEQPMPSRRWSFFRIALENARDRATDGTKRSQADMHMNAQLFADFKNRHPKEFAQLSV